MKVAKLSLKIFKYFIIGVFSVIVLLNIIGIVKKIFFKEEIPMVFGFGSAVVLTGSMEPEIAPGYIIIIHEQSDYEVGDIITFRSSTYITHRIVQKTPTGYITQGDANNVWDQEIEQNQIIGKIIGVIPYAGNVILLFQSPFGILILISVIFAIEIPRFFKTHSKKA